MLYIIGLGLNPDGISREGLIIAKKCKKIYLENYTVEFPYSLEAIENLIEKKIFPADREFIESCRIVDDARKTDIALLVYGSPLTATTHITLVQEARASEVKYKIIYSASVIDAVAETGLQLYKFGKIASIPEIEADSFMEIVKENQKIEAHSLILVDIGLSFSRAVKKLETASEKHKIKLDKIIVCSKLGTDNRKIVYENIENLRDKEFKIPFCFILPAKLHFLEKEILDSWSAG